MRPKPGTRWLLLLCFLCLPFTQNRWVERLECDLYDVQLRLARKLAGDPPLSSELVLVALDGASVEQGFSRADLEQAAGLVRATTELVEGPQLNQIFIPDADGKVRGITVVVEGRPTALLELYLRHRNLTLEQLQLPVDGQGRIYPVFPYAERESFSAGSPLGERGMLAALLHSVEGLTTGMARLAPVSLANLPEIAERLEGRITLFGTYLKSGESLERATPSGRMVALELYASGLDALLSERWLAPLPSALDLLLTMVFLYLLCAALPGQRATGAVGLWLGWLALWFAANQGLLALGVFAERAPALLLSALALLGHLLARSRRLAYLLSGFGGSEVVEPEKEMVLSICFTNLPSYIKELEKTDLARSHQARADYARCLGWVIQAHQGRLMDAQGDAQMLAFGLHGEPNHATQAAACALEIVTQVRGLLKASYGEADAGVYCGIFTGPVALGRVGGGSYQSVSAIGDTTNAAARLMGQAKKFGRAVVAPRVTIEQLGPRVQSEPLGEVSVKGRKEPIQIAEIQGFSSPPTPLLKTASTRPPRAPWTLLAAAALLSVVAALWLDDNLPLRTMLLDAVTPNSAGAPIIWARIDEESLQAHPWPWPRSWHARTMKNCLEAGVACAFYDVLFEQPSTENEDQALLRTVTQHPEVVVAAVATADHRLQAQAPQLLGGLLRSDSWALINASFINRDPDLQLRYALWELRGFSDRPELVAPGVARAVCRRVDPKRAAALEGKRFFPIRWGPPPRSVSYHRLLNPEDPIMGELAGKIVVVGDGLSGPSDTFETPVGSLKGSLIQCFAIQTVLTDGVLQDWSQSPVSLLPSLLFALLTIGLCLHRPGLGQQFLLFFGGLVAALLVTLLLAKIGVFLGARPLLAGAFAVLAAGLLRVLNITRALTTYIPRSVQQKLETGIALKDRDVWATVMVTDIRGYTTLSEKRSPVELLQLLNRYHELTAACYQKHGGHLLTYQGDAQLIVFGAVEPLSHPALSAYRAAQSIAGVLQEMQAEFRVGAGITTGVLSLSLIRAGQQFQYTVVGEPVRRAHHLQSQSDRVGSPILLDHDSYLQIRDSVPLRSHTDEEGMPFYTPSK